MRIQIAQAAGQSELVAAIVEGVSGCTTSVEECVSAAIVQLGGLTTRNLVSLAELAAGLEAVGVLPAIIAQALDAYSTEVSLAVLAGRISEEFAALTLAEEAFGALYG